MRPQNHIPWRFLVGLPLFFLLFSLVGWLQTVRADHTPDPTSVTIAGSLQDELGCPGDWQADCAATHLAYDATDDVWQAVFNVPGGNWEYKAALNDSWDENYGANGVAGGANIPLTLGAASDVKFYYDHKSHWITDNVNSVIATVPGSFQDELGCSGEWQPDCLLSWLQDVDGDGTYTFTTDAIPAGSYEAKVTINESWDENYGEGGIPGGANIPFSVGDGDVVTFSYDAVSHILTITAVSPGGCQSGASQDNNVWWNDLGHNSRDTLYRTPGGAVTTGTAVTLRLRSACNDLTNAQVRIWDDRVNAQQILDMSLAASDSQYDYWEATLPVSSETTIYWYRFIAQDGSSTAYYEDDDGRTGGWGQTYGSSPDNSWQLTMYDPAFQTPDWVKNGIMYQIFPERFRDGDPANNTPAGSFHYDIPGGSIVRSNGTDWNTPLCDPRDVNGCFEIYGQNFYGGDLQGILNELDYLQDLGVTVIYMNPIFESPSNHKYDTTDFSVIDDNFGDLALFQTLVTEAHNRGINVVLDGVFNHTSSDSIYFDRYNRYPAPDGACESETSQYRDWYFFSPAVTPGTGSCAGDTDYESWFGFDSLPKLDSGNQAVRDFVYDGGPNAIARFWMQYADGWRLDVAGDVDPGVTNDPNNGYWEGFRTAVHSTNPDAYIVGEEWNVATAWTLGNEWDATMNYQFSSAVLSFWRDTTFTDNDHNAGSSAGELTPLTPSQLDGRLHNLEERYPAEAFYAMMNLLGSHDTNRALFMLDENTGLNDQSLYQDPNYDWSDAITRLKGVALLQMTLPGAPTIYYGDEVGLVGPVTWDGATWQDDPYNRLPYPWLDETGTPFYTHLQSQATQDEMRNYYKTLTAARNSHPALRTGSFDTLLVDDAANVYVYGRLLSDYSDVAVVIINRATTAQDVTVNVSGYLPFGAQFVDALNGGSYMVAGNGDLTVTAVPGMSGAVLLLDVPMAAPPAAVTDLVVTAVGSGEVDLAWSAAAGADSYDILRSPLSGGGYELIANITGTSYTDSGLTNATSYYYVVVSRNDSSGLVSDPSNEVSGIPGYNLTGAWYNLQWPPSIVHTISTSTPTENIYGQIWIDGVTSQPGPTEGLLAQVGFGPDGATPDNSWTWVDMAFNTDVGNNDEYVGNLLPDQLGLYDYVTRYSSDGGNSWFYADLSGPSMNGNPGSLEVVTSSDTTPPAAPVNLVLTGTSNGHIGIAWEANSEADLAGYEIYRENVAAPGFSRIAQVDTAVTDYNDNSVTTGATYNYYVVAYDTSFNRSAASNTVQGTAEPRLVTTTFRIGVPAYTPGTVFIVGNIDDFGPWNPGLTPMTQVDATTWEYTLDILDGTQLEYKFTRGNWETVEAWGSIVGLTNRQVTISYGADGTQLVDNTATDWGNGPDDSKAVQLWRDPIVTAYSPVDGAVDVEFDTLVTVSWSLPMDAGTSFEVSGPDGLVPGSFSYDAATDTTTFTPDQPLAPETTYTVTVAAQVSNGNFQQVPVIFSFATRPLTVDEQYEALLAELDMMEADGRLSQRDAHKLRVRVLVSQQLYHLGLNHAAAKQMQIFNRFVWKMELRGRLAPEDAAVLLAMSDNLIEDLLAE